MDPKRWDADVATAHYYNTAFHTIDGHIDMSLEKFKRLTNTARPCLDLNLALLSTKMKYTLIIPFTHPNIDA